MSGSPPNNTPTGHREILLSAELICWPGLVVVMCDRCKTGRDCYAESMGPHDLKEWPEPFSEVKKGRKRHEVRVFDRNYQPGDDIILREYDPNTEQYTGETVNGYIGDVTWPGTFGLPENIGCFSFFVTAD